ncbi:hypothetical protein [Desulfococcus sp.]|uniref:hypothetical protein n=1 Tax=Desulfococcus sp. TaxID=2025834 RepID=UPI003593D9B0
MSMIKLTNTMRLALSLLLALSLTPAVPETQWSVGLKDPPPGHKTLLFTPVFDAGVVSAFTEGRRTHFNTFDGPSKNAWILGRIPFGLARKSLSPLSEYDTGFAHRADRAAIPIRAPPCRHKCLS